MPKKVETYQSEDGTFHATEIAAIRHEVLNALWLAVPELRDRKPLVENNIDKIAKILQPLGSHIPDPEGTHAEGPMLESEDGKCIICRRPGLCSKGCPNEADRIAQHGGQVRCRVAHPPGTRCPVCADVPRSVTVIPAPEARARG